MSDESRIELTELLVHADWVQRLARRLVADGPSADDLVQATWLEALRRPPRERGDLRAWLGRVLRNQARASWRGERSRAGRERASARPEAVDGPDAIVERAHRQRELAGMVLGLDEPYRTTILLRFFEDRSPREIAERQGVAQKTVHSRIARGLERLRGRLDQEYGERERWQRALVPFVPGLVPDPLAAAEAALPSGGLLVKVKLQVAVAAAILAVGGVGAVRWLGGGSPAASTPASPVVELDGGERGEVPRGRAVVEAEEARRSVAGELRDRAEASAPPAAPDGFAVSGRVLDTRGYGVEGLRLFVTDAPAAELGRSGAAGEFEIVWSGRDVRLDVGGRLRAGGAGWMCLRECRVDPNDPEGVHVVVVARAGALEGWTVDESGVPIPDAEVALDVLGVRLLDFPEVLDRTANVRRAQRTDDAGSFRLDPFPDAPGVRLSVSALGFVTRRIELENAPRPLVIELRRAADRQGQRVRGVVLDERGQPVEGALVELAGNETRSAYDGSFELIPGRVQPRTPLCASAPGRLPALVPAFGEVLAAAPGDPEPVELMLGGPPLALLGRLVEPSGEPCAGWTLRALDETTISQFQIPVRTAEQLVRGEAEASATDADGRFSLEGLYDREYRLLFLDERSLRSHEVSLEAGPIVHRVVVPAAGGTDWAGRVVGRDGRPVPDVELALSLDIFRSELGSSSISGARTRTGDDGRFAFEDVPTERVYLSLSGDGILPDRYVPEQGPRGDLVVPVVRRCHIRVEGAASLSAQQRFRLLDAEGRQLQLNRFEAFGMSSFPDAPLEAGRSETLSVSELAATLELLEDGEPVRRVPIRLVPGEVTVLRP